MSGWSESTLRAAASWQAYKEGKALLANGAVTASEAEPGCWRGSVRSGQRLLRVSVVVKSATDLETRCACPDNRSTGALCAHAVAVGLAALTGGSKPKEVAEAPSTAASVVAWDVVFSQNWRDSISRGKLAPVLSLSSDGQISAADERICAWLAKVGQAPKPTLNLALDETRLDAFLRALADHPRLATGKSREPIEIRTAAKLALSKLDRGGDHVRIVPEKAGWISLGESFWQINGNALARAGDSMVPVALKPLFEGREQNYPSERFLENLKTWQEWLAVPADSWLGALHFIPATPAIELSLEGSLQQLDAGLLIRYGSSPPVMPGLGKIDGLPRMAGDRCEIRNLPAEENAVGTLVRAGFQPTEVFSGKFSLKGESAIVDFLAKILPELRQRWKVTEGERFGKAAKQVAIVTPEIRILGSGEDWMSFDLSFQTTDGIKVDAAEIRRLLRSGSRSGQVAGGKRLVISDEVSDVIEPLFAELDLRQEQGHYVASKRVGELIRNIANKEDNAQIFKEIGSFEKPPSLVADLRPYQSGGAAWLEDRVSRFGGALLADDMGLGKTLQTIALIERLAVSAPAPGVVLVVATASLLGNWRAEISRFAPARKVRILHGSSRDSERQKVEPGDVILTSYGTLARDLAWHLQREYLAVVVDEASLMRNPDTDYAKAISKLRSNCRVALTGTPLENGVRDLWSIFRFVMPGWLGSREEFRERYEVPLAAGQSAVLERLRLKTSPFMLRRTKEQVAPELPSKIFIDEFCDLSPDQQAVYRELLVEGRKRVDEMDDAGNKGAARMRMLTALLRLRQTCCDLALLKNERFNQLLVPRRSAKLSRLLELVDEAISGGHRLLVFSQFQTQLQEIEKALNEREHRSFRLDGGTRNRQQLVDNFQKPDGPPVFLISLKAGGYGLNLTAADTVIHFDPWWNPAAEAQATDRAHRIGQTRPVTVYRLLTRETVEEKVVRLQAKKRALAAAIDETGAGEAHGWSDVELMGLIEA